MERSDVIKGNAVQRQALEALAKSADGLTATALGALLWPGRVRTHFAAGAVLFHLRKRDWAVRDENGINRITISGADRLIELLETPAVPVA